MLVLRLRRQLCIYGCDRGLTFGLARPQVLCEGVYTVLLDTQHRQAELGRNLGQAPQRRNLTTATKGLLTLLRVANIAHRAPFCHGERVVISPCLLVLLGPRPCGEHRAQVHGQCGGVDNNNTECNPEIASLSRGGLGVSSATSLSPAA